MKREIAPLTALRGIAAMLVVAGHWRQSFDRSFIFESSTMLFANSYLAVDFFFILSGFILAYVHGDEFRAGTGRYGDFLLKRLARIYPLHLATLAFLIAWQAGKWIGGGDAFGVRMPVSAVPAHLFLAHAWGVHDSLTWNEPSWSISAEWAAYLFFPVSFWLFAIQPAWRAAVAVIAAMAVLVVLSLGPLGLARTVDLGAIRCLAGFGLGIAVHRAAPHAPRWLVSDSWIAAVALGIIAVLHFDLNDALVIPLFGALILAASRNGTVAASLLSARPLHRLGVVSYSIYLIHIPMIIVFWDVAPKLIRPEPQWLMLLVFLAGWAAVVPVACVTHALIEKPGRKLLASLRSTRTAPAHASPARPPAADGGCAMPAARCPLCANRGQKLVGYCAPTRPPRDENDIRALRVGKPYRIRYQFAACNCAEIPAGRQTSDPHPRVRQRQPAA